MFEVMPFGFFRKTLENGPSYGGLPGLDGEEREFETRSEATSRVRASTGELIREAESFAHLPRVHEPAGLFEASLEFLFFLVDLYASAARISGPGKALCLFFEPALGGRVGEGRSVGEGKFRNLGQALDQEHEFSDDRQVCFLIGGAKVL